MKRIVATLLAVAILLLGGCGSLDKVQSKSSWLVPYNLKMGASVSEVQKACGEDFMIQPDRYTDAYVSDAHTPILGDHLEFLGIDIREYEESELPVSKYWFYFDESRKLCAVVISDSHNSDYLYSAYYDALYKKFDTPVTRYNGYYAWEGEKLAATLDESSCYVTIMDISFYLSVS